MTPEARHERPSVAPLIERLKDMADVFDRLMTADSAATMDDAVEMQNAMSDLLREAAQALAALPPETAQGVPQFTAKQLQQLDAALYYVQRESDWGVINVPMDGTYAGRYVWFTRADLAKIRAVIASSPAQEMEK